QDRWRPVLALLVCPGRHRGGNSAKMNRRLTKKGTLAVLVSLFHDVLATGTPAIAPGVATRPGRRESEDPGPERRGPDPVGAVRGQGREQQLLLPHRPVNLQRTEPEPDTSGGQAV